MTILDDFIGVGMAAMLTTDGETVTIREVDYTAVVSPLDTDTAWGAQGAGAKPLKRCTVDFLTPDTDFSQPLRIGEPITIRGAVMRIDTIQTGSGTYSLTCTHNA